MLCSFFLKKVPFLTISDAALIFKIRSWIPPDSLFHTHCNVTTDLSEVTAPPHTFKLGSSFFGQVCHRNIFVSNIFFISCLVVPLGHYWGNSFTHPMFITGFCHIWPVGDREPYKVGPLNLAECLVGFKTETFQFTHKALSY